MNLPDGKNIVGTIYHPKLILIAMEFLNTLPIREFRAGLAEVIKYGVIWDPELFELLQNNMNKILEKERKKLEAIIGQSCSIKAQIVKQDEKEQGLRAILNFGHTFAHAIETATDYKTYLHGEAVAIGMSCAAQLSKILGLIDKTTVKQIDDLCLSAGLPIDLPDIAIDHVIQLMYGDKKTVSGKISLIVVQKIGKVIQTADVNPDLIREALLAKKG